MVDWFTMKISSMMIAAIVVLSVLLGTVTSKPVAMPDSAKIRIHVPVKHHTHLHTKTVVKTVHVGIPVKPVKAHHDDSEDDGWEFSKKKKLPNNYLKLLNH
ncbi:uncharacterized protein LOC129748839 isoform X2 [Uranotaenia lowii]|uniref:uncharacterized protein LOC129748839 isoform X2 n=1 Tax=Uranotaenia lowii TaxID=190385 RepID=UPI002479E21E|nr:uncharacterized protein LOC129748839 isoform X2 [Uranotaenia lowii]